MDAQPALDQANTPLDDEVVAALAAVEAYLAAEQFVARQDQAAHPHQPWRDSAKLVVQHLQPGRTRAPLRWSTIERSRRDTGGGYGVVGL